MFIKLDFQACTTPTIVAVIATKIAVMGLLNIAPVKLAIDRIPVTANVLKPPPAFEVATPSPDKTVPDLPAAEDRFLSDPTGLITTEANFANLLLDNCKEAEKERKKLVTLFPSPSIFSCL